MKRRGKKRGKEGLKIEMLRVKNKKFFKLLWLLNNSLDSPKLEINSLWILWHERAAEFFPLFLFKWQKNGAGSPFLPLFFHGIIFLFALNKQDLTGENIYFINYIYLWHKYIYFINLGNFSVKINLMGFFFVKYQFTWGSFPFVYSFCVKNILSKFC